MKKSIRVTSVLVSVLIVLMPFIVQQNVLADSSTELSGQPEIVDNDQVDFDSEIDGMLQKNNFCGSIFVVKGGKTIYSKNVGDANYKEQLKNRQNKAYEIDSIQKSLTAGLIMKLVQEHKLSLDDKLSKFLPEVPGSNQITLRMMLDMTSGLVLPNDGPSSVMPDDRLVDFDTHEVTFSKSMLNKWQYSPINFVFLARIVEMVTHKTYKHVFTKEYIDKLHLKHTVFAFGPSHGVEKAQGYTNRDPLSPRLNYNNPYMTQPWETRDEMGTGQVFMSPEDLYKAEKYLVSGKFLTKESRDVLFTPGSISTYGGGFYNNHNSHQSNGWGYGYQSVIHISDDGKTAVVVMSNYQRLANNIKPMARQIYSMVLTD
ncbi:serine hydrolase domain-containing protein [Companilactobacillus ginsenosidimutans]|uniref:Penicillin-binding protein n=1 Tax=Companilactobacillus ginsenosidimutans TaxID=1007676 RepID=A0A0H4QXV3_9LACO|nr:serine hydrolase domain-containing protein [Companilactobacillus ginsenosidimutans]AKP66305.1 penicillin-binding protein [Companilactobacillus ginsenosidimutans]